MLLEVLTDALTLGGRVWPKGAVIDSEAEGLLWPIPEHVFEEVQAGQHRHLRKVTKKEAAALAKVKVESKPEMPPAGVRPVTSTEESVQDEPKESEVGDSEEEAEPLVQSTKEQAKGAISSSLVHRQRKIVQAESVTERV